MRRHAAAAAVLASLAALYFWLTAYADVGALNGDGLIYLHSARHYAPHWPDDPFAAVWASVTQFPPAYPALLAATGGIFDLRLAHGATTACLLAALATGYAWLVALGVPRASAAAAIGLVGLAPGTFLQSLYLHPEGLYVALVFAALLGLHAGERTSQAHGFWLACAATALAILTRTVGVALLPALLLALARGKPRHWPFMLALAVLPGLAWNLLHRPGWSYSDTLTESYLGAPLDAVVRQVAASIAAASGGFVDNLVRAGPLRVLAAVAAAFAAGVALWRFARGRADAWYVAAYLGALALWPYPQEAQRLAWVLVPFLVGYVACGAGALAAKWGRPRLAWAALALLAAAIVPEFLALGGRAVHPLARRVPEYRHYPEWYAPQLEVAWSVTELRLRTVEALRRFEPQIPEGECAYATLPYLIGGTYVRRGLPAPPPEALTDAEFERAVAGGECRYFIFTYERDARRGFTQPLYPLARIREHVDVVDEQRMADGKALVAALGVLKGG